MYDVQHARRPQAAAGRLLIYDVRCTMYDLGSSRAYARVWRNRNGGGIMEQRTDIVRKRREAVADGACLCTMYDFRCTTRTTAVSADGQRACVARRANRQGGAGESIWGIRALCAGFGRASANGMS